jgi:hypothetical protein
VASIRLIAASREPSDAEHRILAVVAGDEIAIDVTSKARRAAPLDDGREGLSLIRGRAPLLVSRRVSGGREVRGVFFSLLFLAVRLIGRTSSTSIEPFPMRWWRWWWPATTSIRRRTDADGSGRQRPAVTCPLGRATMARLSSTRRALLSARLGCRPTAKRVGFEKSVMVGLCVMRRPCIR